VVQDPLPFTLIAEVGGKGYALRQPADHRTEDVRQPTPPFSTWKKWTDAYKQADLNSVNSLLKGPASKRGNERVRMARDSLACPAFMQDCLCK